MALPQLTQPELVELDGFIRESMDSLIRQEAEKDLRKDIAENAKEKFKISPSDFKKLVDERMQEKSTNAIDRHSQIQSFDEDIRIAVRNARK